MKVIGSGGGGKGGGSSGGITEDDDSLSSVASARIVELLGEGPIEGLVNNEYSIYLDNVALRDLSGTPNYKPFQFSFLPGTQSQLPIPGFSGTLQEVSVGVKITVSAGALIRSIPDADADSVVVTISVNGLSKTDPTAGKITGTTVAYRVYVRVVAGSWSLAVDSSISGKTGAKYSKQHEIPLVNLGPGPYEVKVERATADSTSSLVVDGLFWDGYTVTNYEQFSYPNSALVALSIDSRYFSAIPSRTYHVRGLLVRVPKNYDVANRLYRTTGIGTTNGGWDGTFKVAYTNNPAWCYYDLVTSTRYGLGKRISEAQIDKWALYEIAQYCDGLVPTGLSNNIFDVLDTNTFSASGALSSAIPVVGQNMEPRFTLNCVINTRDDAYRILNQLSSAFRGMTYWSSGMVSVTQDSPRVDSKIFANANVIDGLFNYAGSSRADRHTVCTVGWNDPSENFTQKFEYVEDRAGIQRYGVKSTDIIAFGCTSRSQARRVGLWLLYTERLEKDAISFDVGLDAAQVVPGEIIQILDVDRTGARWGGRVKASTLSSVTLDAEVHLEAGSYQLSTMTKDGTVSKRAVNITTEGDFSVLNVSVAYDVAPSKGVLWTIASTVVTPMLARVIGIKQAGATRFTLSAVEHNPSKFDAIELGIPALQQNYSFLSYNKLPDITGLVAVETSVNNPVSGTTQTNVSISWDAISDPLVRGYRVNMVGSISRPLNNVEKKEANVTVEAVTPDSYTISVAAVNALGIVGTPAIYTLGVTGAGSTPPANPAGLAAVVTKGGWLVTWAATTDQSISATELRIGGTDWITATPLFKGLADRYVMPFLASGSHTLRLRNWSGVVGSVGESDLTIQVNAPTAPAVSSADVSVGSVEFRYNDCTGTQPLQAVLFKIGTTSQTWDFAAAAGAAGAGQLSHTIVFTDVATHRVFLRGIDVYGNLGDITFADVTPGAFDVDTLLDLIDGNIEESMLAAALAQKIDLIDAPDTTVGSVAQRIASEAQARGTAVTNEASARSTADGQLATSINSLTAVTNSAIAAITTEATARANGDTASANRIDALVAASPSGALNQDPTCSSLSDYWTPNYATLTRVAGSALGRFAFRAGGLANYGPQGKVWIPVSIAKTYRARVRARKSADSNGLFYLFIEFRDASGTHVTIPGQGGSYSYYPVSGVTLTTTFTDFSVTFGNGQPVPIPATAVEMTIGVILQYQNTVGTSWMEVEQIRLEDAEAVQVQTALSAQITTEQNARIDGDQAATDSLTVMRSRLDTTGSNLLLNSSFERDSDSDGVGDSWVAYYSTPTTPTWTRVAGRITRLGQQIAVSALGATNSTRIGVYQNVSVVPGSSANMTASVYGKGTAGTQLYIYLEFYTTGFVTLIGSSLSAGLTLSAVMQRTGLTAVVPSTAAIVRIYIWQSTNPSGSAASVVIDDVLLEPGDQLNSYSMDRGEAASVDAVIVNEQQTRAAADSANALSINTVSARLNSGGDISNALVQVATTANTAKGTADTTASQLTTVQSSLNDNSAAVAQEITTRTNQTGFMSAYYGVRVQLTSGGVPVIGGFGIMGTSSATAGPRVDFAIRADRIYFLPPEGTSDTGYQPFVYYTTTQTINGVVIQPGLYIRNASIEYITADKIDTRNLTIKDAAGNVVFSSGVNALIASGGNNMLKNSRFPGRVLSTWTWSSTDGLGYGDGVDSWAGDYSVDGDGGVIRHAAAGSPDAAYTDFYPITPLPAVGGATYQFSAYVLQHRTGMCIFLQCLNSAGALITYVGAPFAAYSQLPANGTNTATRKVGTATDGTGRFLNNYTRVYFTATIPGNCVSVRPFVRMFYAPTTSDHYVFFQRLMLCEVPAGTISVAPYDTGAGIWAGAQTINGGNISTYMESAAIGSAYIQNAAINTAHIQIAAIKAANIGDLEVDTIKIRGRAITSPSGSSLPSDTNFFPSSNGVIMSTQVDMGADGGPIFVYASVTQDPNTTGTAFLTFLIDGNQQLGTYSLNNLVKSLGMSLFINVGAGVHQIDVKLTGAGGIGTLKAQTTNMYAVGCKR